MSVVKSFSVGDGDMFYIDHNSDNFTTIDCCYSDDENKEVTILSNVNNKINKNYRKAASSSYPLRSLNNSNKSEKFSNINGFRISPALSDKVLIRIHCNAIILRCQWLMSKE